MSKRFPRAPGRPSASDTDRRGVNIPVGSLADENTVGNLNAVNIPAESSVAEGIANVVATASIATERERQQCATCQQALRQPDAGEPFLQHKYTGLDDSIRGEQGPNTCLSFLRKQIELLMQLSSKRVN